VRHNISVRTELADDLPRIIGDRVQLQRVAMDLIVNSIEAMKDVDGMREMIIRSQHAENAQILVSISDTGVGIPPQLAEQIFDPFFTTKAHGTGMGLRICRSIIEAHGGRLWVVGSSGRGATFQLNLPPRFPATAIRLDDRLKSIDYEAKRKFFSRRCRSAVCLLVALRPCGGC
jgi:signal transduction histidine kinase